MAAQRATGERLAPEARRRIPVDRTPDRGAVVMPPRVAVIPRPVARHSVLRRGARLELELEVTPLEAGQAASVRAAVAARELEALLE